MWFRCCVQNANKSIFTPHPLFVQFEMLLKAFLFYFLYKLCVYECVTHKRIQTPYFFGYTEINIVELFIIIWNEIVCKMVISRWFFPFETVSYGSISSNQSPYFFCVYALPHYTHIQCENGANGQKWHTVFP